jgi:hypothetical protein
MVNFQNGSFFCLPTSFQLIQDVDDAPKTEVPVPGLAAGKTLDGNQRLKMPSHERHHCVDR